MLLEAMTRLVLLRSNRAERRKLHFNDLPLVADPVLHSAMEG
jgi:hypothetical protein